MAHLKAITLPQHATILANGPEANDGGSSVVTGDNVIPILDTTFGFVLDLVSLKGKGSS